MKKWCKLVKGLMVKRRKTRSWCNCIATDTQRSLLFSNVSFSNVSKLINLFRNLS